MKSPSQDHESRGAVTEDRRSGGDLGIPDFEMIKRIGRGSYGQVWLARSATGSYRAVKVVFRDSFDSASPYEREFAGIQQFEPISRAHPGQLDILHVGRNDEEDFFYYVMELADDASVMMAEREEGSTRTGAGSGARTGTGTRRKVDPEHYEPDTLQRHLKERGRLTAMECLETAIELAEALRHLHANGLVHRDIKPSNIIFVRGRPKLADIGLVAHAEEKLSVVGTEGFIPPEGPGQSPADLYGLGKVFYEMATGRDRRDFPQLPEPSEEAREQRAFIEFNEVILRCCERSTENRYQSAADLLTDLNLLRQGRSIKRLRTVERRLAQMRRISLAGVAVLVLISGAYLYQRQIAQKQEKLAGAEREQRERAEGATAEARAAVRLHELHEIERLLETGETSQALASLAQRVRVDRNDRDAARRLLAVLTYRNFALPVAEFRHDDLIVGADLSPDGRWLATATEPGEVMIWDLRTGIQQAKVRGGDFGLAEFGGSADKVRWNVHFNRDGSRLVAPGGSERAARIWRMPASGKPELNLEIAHRGAGRFTHAEFSPDGSRLVTVSSSGDAYVWDSVSGEEVARLNGGSLVAPDGKWPHWVFGRFTSDGAAVVTSVSQARPGENWTGRFSIGHFSVWDSGTGEHLARHDDPGYTTRSIREFWHEPLALEPEGSRIVWRRMSHQPTYLQVWDYESGRVESAPQFHEWPINTVAFSPAGGLIASGSNDQSVRLWEVSEGLKLRHVLPQSGMVDAVNFRPDAGVLAVALRDGTVQRWDPVSGEPVGEPLQHAVPIRHLEFSPDGASLVCFGSRSAWVWDLRPGEARPNLLIQGAGGDLPGYLKALRFSPDGEWLMTSLGGVAQGGGYGSTLRADGAVNPRLYSQLWDAVTGDPAAPAPIEKGRHETRQTVVVNADGSRALTAAEGGAVWWDPRTGLVLGRTEDLGFDPEFLAISPDGRWAVLSDNRNPAELWNLDRGERHAAVEVDGAILAAVFSPDSQLVLTVSAPGIGTIRRVRDGEPVVVLEELSIEQPYWGHLGILRWSPDGTLVTFAHGPRCALYRTDSGRRLEEWSIHHTGNVRDLEFTLDGSHLLTASSDRTAKLWDVAGGRQAVHALQHRWVVAAATFDVRAEQIATASWDKSARVWDRATGLPLTAALQHPDWVLAVAFHPNGRWLATGCRDGMARIWELPEAPEGATAPDWLPALAEYLGGYRRTSAESLERVADSCHLIELQEGLATGRESEDYYGRWAAWFVADRGERKISPSAHVDVPVYRSRLEAFDSLKVGAHHEALLHLSPLEPGYLARAAHKLAGPINGDEEADLKRADWLTRLAVQRDPDLAMARWARAEVLLALGQVAEAGEAVDRALELEAEDANAWLVKALVLYKTGADTEALEAFKKSARLAEEWKASGGAERGYLDALLQLIAEATRADHVSTSQLVQWCGRPERTARLKLIGDWLAQ